jgi:signal transduction histidine kinase/ligand-binding sensor domain-containing protein
LSYPFLSSPRLRLLAAHCSAGIVLSLLPVGRATPATWHRRADAYTFDAYGAEAGLPGSVVNVALQTRDGYLWVGTPSGLGRFDGVRFTNFHRPDDPAPLAQSIHCLYEDRTGVLWIGTARGLVRRTPAGFEVMELPHVAVRAIAEDRDGLWVATGRQGIWRRQGERFVAFADPLVPPTSAIRTLCCDHEGAMWIALDRGRGVLRHFGGVTRRVDSGEFAPSEVLSICEWPTGTMWFGTQRLGLFRWREGRWQQFAVPGSAPRGPITDLRVTHDDTLWIAAGALWHATAAEPFAPEVVSSVPNDNVRTLYEDFEAGLWLCAGAEGLLRMRAMPYRLFSTEEGLPTNNVKTVAEDPGGALWVGLQHQGIVQVRENRGAEVQDDAFGIPALDPAVVYPARDGTIWAGINSRLFVRRDEHWTRRSDLRFIRGIYEDRTGAMWVGTEAQGVFRFEREQPKEVKPTAGPSILLATAFSESADGTMYIGTWRTGVFRVRGDNVTPLDHAHGLPNDDVRDVHVDRDGTLWVGLAGRGLAVWDHDRWLNPDSLAAALANHVSAIAEDATGRLWFGTPAGIMWAQRSELLTAARNEAAAPAVHTIATGSDTRSLPVWSGGQPVAWNTHDRKLLFATRRGIVVIDPEHISNNTVVPPVHIEAALIDRRPAPVTAAIDVPPGARSVAIEYTALSLVQPARVAFKYKLEGYDTDWIDAGTRRTAVYHRLPPGTYRFHVAASNNDGLWNLEGASLTFVQRPYFYQTRWFKGAIGAGGLAALWGVYYWSNRRLRVRVERLEQERAMENERRRIAQDLHDDLGARLTEIGLVAETAVRGTTPESKAEIGKLSERVRQVVGALDAIVWAVNPENDSLDDLVAYVADMYQELFRRSSIRARLEISPDIPLLPLNADERSNLYLAVKEATNNVLKHSRATESWLRIAYAAGSLRLSIEDNGCGFDPASADTGNGLANIRRRIAKLGGTLRFDSQVNHGTTVSINVPLAHRAPGRGSERRD